MRPTLVVSIALALIGPSCSKSTPTTPSPTSATITVRAPASVASRACTGCGLVGELEAVADLVVEETAGVAGQITAVDVVLRTGSAVIAGPGQFDAAGVSTFGGGTNRIGARGSLTLRSIGPHFAGTLRAQLPATLTFTVRFRDDRGNVTSADAATQVTP